MVSCLQPKTAAVVPGGYTLKLLMWYGMQLSRANLDAGMMHGWLIQLVTNSHEMVI